MKLHRQPPKSCVCCGAVVTLEQPGAFDHTGKRHTELLEECRRWYEGRPARESDALTLGLLYLNIGQPSTAVKLLKTVVAADLGPPELRAQVRKLVEHLTGQAPTPTGSAVHRTALLRRAPKQPVVAVLVRSRFVCGVVATILGEVGYLVERAATAAELAATLRQHGSLQALIVEAGHPALDDGTIAELAGEARWPVVLLGEHTTRASYPWAACVEAVAVPLWAKPFLALVGRLAPMPSLREGSHPNITRSMLRAAE